LSFKSIAGYVSLATIVALFLFLVPHTFERQAEIRPTQSDFDGAMVAERRTGEAGRNIRWAAGESVVPILKQDRGVKPPMYPVVLHYAYKAGVKNLQLVNATFFAIILLLMWLTARSLMPAYGVMALMLFAVLFEPFYINFAAFRAEGLFMIASFMTMYATERYWLRPDWPGLLLIAGSLALLCFTRYFGLFWLLPLSGLIILIRHYNEPLKAILRGGVAGFLAIVPAGLFMLDQYVATGYLTGIDRFSTRYMEGDRVPIDAVSDFFMVVATDFSPASYEPFYWLVGSQLALWVGLPVFILMAVAFFMAMFRRLPAGAIDVVKGSTDRTVLRGTLVAIYALSYMVCVTTLWAFGNNDPLWSRFLLPMYPFMLITLAAACSTPPLWSGWRRLIILGIYAMAIVFQLWELYDM